MEITATLQRVPQLGYGPFPEPGKSSSWPRIPLKTEFSIVLPPKPLFLLIILSKSCTLTICPTQFILLNSTTPQMLD